MKYTLNDKLVQSGLTAVTSGNVNGLLLAGGMANQMYIFPVYPDILRPTHDADFSRLPPMDSSTFNILYQSSITPLAEYKPRRGTDREGYFIQLRENQMPFFIHFERPTKRYWERVNKLRERQFSTANEICIPDTTSKLKVIRPEELIAAKLRRLNYLADKGLLSPQASDVYNQVKQRQFNRLAETNFPACLGRLIQLKNSLSGHFEAGVEHGTIARLSYNGEKDLYDISLLAKLFTEGRINFDERYYEEALKT